MRAQTFDEVYLKMTCQSIARTALMEVCRCEHSRVPRPHGTRRAAWVGGGARSVRDALAAEPRRGDAD